jgi:hypothetical protein
MQFYALRGGALANLGKPQCLGGKARVDDLHEVQNHVSDSAVTDGGVDHGVVNTTVRPFDAKIFLYEIFSLAVDGIYELLGFDLTLAAIYQAPHLVFPRSIKKYAQGILSVPEKVL